METNTGARKGWVVRLFSVQLMMKVLVFSILIQALSLWGMTQPCRWDCEKSGQTLSRLIIFLSPQEAQADVSAFGPKKYVRTTGNPNVFTDTFPATAGGGKLIVLNGDENGQHRISSAVIQFNGNQIFGPNDFNQNIYRLERNITLAPGNTLKVELRSSPNSHLTIQILAVTQNHPPIANAGPDQTAFVTQTVMLDGSKSSDVDGDSLTYHWSFISIPSGSGAALSNPSALNPTFVVDKPGTYVAQLIVNDGKVDSTPDTVSISTENSKPIANAGPDQTVYVGNTVTLDGSKSSDVDGDPLSFWWSFTSTSPGSVAKLSDPTAKNPTFRIDLPGIYVVQLIVNDGRVDSAPKTVTITTANSKPVAEAGPDQTVFVGDKVQLDGSASSDADKDPLTFFWSITSKPDQSASVLDSSSKINPTFFPDLSGLYVAQLIVNDGIIDSSPDTTTITANLRMVTVPNVVNMTQAAAQAAITGAKLNVGAITQANSATVPAGSVISQNPLAGTSVAEGSSVSLVISLGPVMVVVPNVVNMTQANAQAAITGAKLNIGTITQANSATVPAGSVISQNPAAGASVAEGSSVTLVISLGPVMVTVPDVVGMTQAAATSTITSAKLAVGTITQANSSSVPA